MLTSSLCGGSWRESWEQTSESSLLRHALRYIFSYFRFQDVSQSSCQLFLTGFKPHLIFFSFNITSLCIFFQLILTHGDNVPLSCKHHYLQGEYGLSQSPSTLDLPPSLFSSLPHSYLTLLLPFSLFPSFPPLDPPNLTHTFFPLQGLVLPHWMAQLTLGLQLPQDYELYIRTCQSQVTRPLVW